MSIDRKEVEYTPALTPNYIMRCFSELPRLYGTHELPSIDGIFSYRFNPADFKLS